jgi:peptidoglycan/xylan/chitin deacetylase (PgdA/CDA1 family)
MSYDDGRTQDRRLVDIFNQNGIKGTFHLNSGLFKTRNDRISPDEIPTLYQGHEVACHTVTHPTIARCPLPEVAHEVLADRQWLEAQTGYPVRGLSYPNGSLSQDIEKLLPGLGIRYSRVVGSSDSFALPENPYRWQATCHHNHRLLELGEQFLALYKQQYLYLMYVWGHSYEFDDKGNWDLMESFCRMMGGKDDIWYCTNIQFLDRMDDFKRLQFTADNSFVYNPNSRVCWISVNDQQAVCLPAGQLTQL